jgi:hypothetical protein
MAALFWHVGSSSKLIFSPLDNSTYWTAITWWLCGGGGRVCVFYDLLSIFLKKGNMQAKK